VPLREHLLAGERQGHEESIRYLHGGPNFPAAAARVWSAFQRLHNRRGGGMGPSPLMWSEIDAFIRLTGTQLAVWEVELLEVIDNTWARVTLDNSFTWKPDGEEE
jgi:hypothetical protein